MYMCVYLCVGGGGVILHQALSDLLFIAWCPNAISLIITKFRGGSYCCGELSGHATALQLQP